MITIFEEQIERLRKQTLKRFLIELENSLFLTLPLYAGFFIEENRLMISKDSEVISGQSIKRTGKSPEYVYSPKYAAYKGRKGLNTKYIDLTLTGSYIESISYTVQGKEFIAEATDEKSILLDSAYNSGSSLIGIKPETKKQFLKEAKKEIFQTVKRRL